LRLKGRAVQAVGEKSAKAVLAAIWGEGPNEKESQSA
jgi:hypothetical protein